ncbi:hypothetical protein [Frankia sp. Cas3]|uniref:hypothetical protein n=1 Tax=Frankia sp. Cas3 TaxID=3073926 RepID=UPI002AD261A0|nr:hypothetical protein [Frankia sp. Cas3]
MSLTAYAAYEALLATRHPLDRAVACLLGAAQGTAPADRWDHALTQIAVAQELLCTAAEEISTAKAEALSPRDDR